jgi:hypothetical protein
MATLYRVAFDNGSGVDLSDGPLKNIKPHPWGPLRETVADAMADALQLESPGATNIRIQRIHVEHWGCGHWAAVEDVVRMFPEQEKHFSADHDPPYGDRPRASPRPEAR